MDNPWVNISWDNPIAEADRIWIEEHYGSVEALENKYRKCNLNLHGALPEPYSGNKDSKVYCLNMNPGEWVDRFSGNDSILDMTIKNLRHEVNDCFWWEKVRDEDNNPHDGYCWVKQKTHLIEDVLGRRPNIFFVEFFPYHSKNGFYFPELPSYKYSNQLINKAIEEGKTIIIMRQVEKWCYRIPCLKTANVITLKSPSAGWLSPNNLGLKGKESLIKEMF